MVARLFTGARQLPSNRVAASSAWLATHGAPTNGPRIGDGRFVGVPESFRRQLTRRVIQSKRVLVRERWGGLPESREGEACGGPPHFADAFTPSGDHAGATKGTPKA